MRIVRNLNVIGLRANECAISKKRRAYYCEALRDSAIIHFALRG